MKLRTLGFTAGIAGTLILALAVSSAFSDPDSRRMGRAEQLLESYAQTNQKVAACMVSKGLSYDARLAKPDVVDAFSVVSQDKVTDKIRKEMAARTEAAPEDPNSALMSQMPPRERSAWVEAMNGCSQQVASEDSGGAAGKAKVDAEYRAAMGSPEVRAAAQGYVDCMRGQGFTVDVNPFVPPQEISAAEAGTSAEGAALVETYTTAWRTCVQPWQQTLDRKLYG